MTRTPPGTPPPEPDGTDAETTTDPTPVVAGDDAATAPVGPTAPEEPGAPAPDADADADGDQPAPADDAAGSQRAEDAEEPGTDEPRGEAPATTVDTPDVEPAAAPDTPGAAPAAAADMPDAAPAASPADGDAAAASAEAPVAAARTHVDTPAGDPEPVPVPAGSPTGGPGADDDGPRSGDGSAPDGAQHREEPPSRPAAQHGRHGAPTLPEPGGLRALGRALRPRTGRSQIIVGVLCALLGFALVAQVSQTQEDQLSSLRQSDLVRLLDDVTQRSGELEEQVASLEATRDELRSGSGRERAALEVAREQEQTQGILSGRLPAQGPGVEIEVAEGGAPLDAFLLFNVLEELRNAGAEAMEVNGVRLVASSYFEDSAGGVVVDGQTLASPYRWTVIGDPSTLETALEIPGGAMASLRSEGARTTINQQDQVEVGATREPASPRYATPVPAEE